MVPFEQVGIEAFADVGGKNASLGEMIRELAAEGVQVLGGFGTSASAYRQLIAVAELFDERHATVKAMIGLAIKTAKRCRRKIGIYGQAPSDYAEFARFLAEARIDSISLNPDAIVRTRLLVAKLEQEIGA